MELLAPAGDGEALKAAIAAGADAVYLGGTEFSARQYAANFDLAEIEAAAELLHLHGKKLYVTVNTLIADSEMEKAMTYLTQLYNLGIDAVIVQDLGLIYLCRRYLPQLNLHASTQMTVHNLEGAVFVKELGISRVVLARELMMNEVAAIAARSGIEVEVFIHGALCICYSGQCLMSSIIGGRSGNRGRCAQPCRLEYQLLKGHTQIPMGGPHLLSPKDLALLPLIPELDRAGVRSLKVEGRMKRPEYVYSVIKVYRKAIDRYLEDPKVFLVEPGELAKLEEVFNRGFTTGYFGGNRNEQLMSYTRPNNRGIFLGRIATADHRTQRVSLKLDAELDSADEIEVWVSQGGRSVGPIRDLRYGNEPVTKAQAGTTVNFQFDGKAFPGDRVFKVFSAGNNFEFKQALGAGNPNLKVACKVEVEGQAGTPLRITYRDNSGNIGAAVSNVNLQIARNHPLTAKVLWEYLGRLGDTPFYLTDIQSGIPGNLMLPISELNRTRRQAITELTRQKLQRYEKVPADQLKAAAWLIRELAPQAAAPEEGLTNTSGSLSVWAPDPAGAMNAIRAGANLIYVGGDELNGFHWDRARLGEAVALGHQAGVRVVIALPRINREGQRKLWVTAARDAFDSDPDGVLVSDLGTLQLTLKESERPVYLNYTFNVFNSFSVKELKANSGSRIRQIALSPELTLKQILSLKSQNPKLALETLIHGPLELMVSEYCPISSSQKTADDGCKNTCKQAGYFLRDRIGLDFPIYMDQFCRMHLLNSMDHCLYQEITQFAKIPGLVLRLDLRTYRASDVSRVVGYYRESLQSLETGGRVSGDPEQVMAEFKAMTGRGITKGHYFRGVE